MKTKKKTKTRKIIEYNFAKVVVVVAVASVDVCLFSCVIWLCIWNHLKVSQFSNINSQYRPALHSGECARRKSISPPSINDNILEMLANVLKLVSFLLFCPDKISNSAYGVKLPEHGMLLFNCH